ncbi:MAG: hypothetical protein H8D78_03275 [Chloroflexi bacterium]|nr:hypothetical protein [Chloroflexota bacterium]
MSEEKSVQEAAVAYAAHAVDIHKPIVLEHDGQPVAAIVPYQDYQRFLRREREQQAAWGQLEELLARVHSQPTDLTLEEIETEVTLALEEVRGEHRARRGSD